MPLASALAIDTLGGVAWQIAPAREDTPRPRVNAFTISDQDTPIFRRALVRPLAVRLAPVLRQEYPQICAGHSFIGLHLAIEESLMRLHEYGLRRHDILKELDVQDLYLGYPFENEDPAGDLARICRSEAPQEERYARLCQRMQQMAPTARTSRTF